MEISLAVLIYRGNAMAFSRRLKSTSVSGTLLHPYARKLENARRVTRQVIQPLYRGRRIRRQGITSGRAANGSAAKLDTLAIADEVCGEAMLIVGNCGAT